jgi:hypothetical protein
MLPFGFCFQVDGHWCTEKKVRQSCPLMLTQKASREHDGNSLSTDILLS